MKNEKLKVNKSMGSSHPHGRAALDVSPSLQIGGQAGRGRCKTTLSVVIPMYNEEARLSKSIRAVLAWPVVKGIELREIIFVDDGSRDATRALLEVAKPQIEAELGVRVRVLGYQENMGKGYAVRMGMLAAKSDYALVCDADMSTPLEELAKVRDYLLDGVPVVVGTRKNGESTVRIAQPWYRRVLGRVFTLVSQVVLATWVSDFTCGFKLFDKASRKAIFNRAKIDRWGYDAEVLFLATRLGYGVREKALYWYNDERSHVRIVRDVVSTLRDLAMIRWNWMVGHYRLGSSHGTLVTRALSWATIRS